MSYKKAYETLLEGVKIANDPSFTAGHRSRTLNRYLIEAYKLADEASRPVVPEKSPDEDSKPAASKKSPAKKVQSDK